MDLGLCQLSGAKLETWKCKTERMVELLGSCLLKDAETWRWEVTCTRSHSWVVIEQERRLADSKSPVFSGTK